MNHLFHINLPMYLDDEELALLDATIAERNASPTRTRPEPWTRDSFLEVKARCGIADFLHEARKRGIAEEFCHCGMLMRDHHQGSSCTTPKSMGAPP